MRQMLTRLRLRRVRAYLPCFVLPDYYTTPSPRCQSPFSEKLHENALFKISGMLLDKTA